MRVWLPLFCLLIPILEAKVTYNSLDPTSISQHLAYYELYKDTNDGKKSLSHAWKLLSGTEGGQIPLAFPQTITSFIALITPTTDKEHFTLDDPALEQIEKIAKRLPNRQLKGKLIKTLEELHALAEDQIDLGRALLLTQLKGDEKNVRLYEALLDLMALQVLARCSPTATPEDKVQALNALIFFELGFRFPPHSSYSQAIDRFTFLPQVLESRRGVCLGVSTLYLCLAQRVGLPIEIITPPGHIFVKVNEINIETTLRGVHIPSDEYLGINLRALPVRSLKEVIGMAFYNQASVFLAQADFQKAKECYEQALPFMPNDAMLKTLYGSALVMCDQPETAKSILKQAKACKDSHLLCDESLVDDILNNQVDKEGLKPFFLYVDETRASIEQKKAALLSALKKWPHFRAGLFQLAICYLQLHQPEQAINVLQKCHALDANDITVEYYLAQLYFMRYDAPSSWKHYQNAEKIATKQGYMPKAAKQLKLALLSQCPNLSKK